MLFDYSPVTLFIKIIGIFEIDLFEREGGLQREWNMTNVIRLSRLKS